MAQPPVQLHQLPPSYSPMAQPPPSVGTPQANGANNTFGQPGIKRQRMDSPGPLSPYSAASPYALSPATENTPSTAATSPSYGTYQTPQYHSQQQYQQVPGYVNGNTPQNTHIPPAHAPQQSPLPSPHSAHPQTPNSTVSPDYPYTTALLNPFPPPPTPGTMGPPSKPAEKTQKDTGFNDVLHGTDVNLQEEEQGLERLYATPFTQGAKTGLPANAPGDRASFYGAGPANQLGEEASQNQEEAIAKAAEHAWNAAAFKLATIRTIELNDPFLTVPYLHYKAEKIGREYGIGLNNDLKAVPSMPFGRAREPVQFDKPSVAVGTRTSSEGTVINTYGSFVPQDAYLVDQLALLSIATKHRLRDLLEEADRLATIRQQTSHGKPGADWEDASAPLLQLNADELRRDLLRSADHNVGSLGENPRKRSLDAASQNAPATDLVTTLREMSRQERNAEEARLLKRLKRTQAAAAPSGGATPAPATPGQIAPEPAAGKPGLTKKEQKKLENAKLTEMASAANANATMNQFLGGRKKKTYSWMTGGGSGTSTPTRGGLSGGGSSIAGAFGSGGAGSTVGGVAGGSSVRSAERTTLTVEGRNRPGLWREDGLKGRGIQLRDWVAALEEDGRDPRAVQLAYDKLDTSTL